MLTGNWHQFNVLARTTSNSFCLRLVEGEQSKRILNVQTPRHHKLTATHKKSTQLRASGFMFHLREWNFVLNLLLEKRKNFRWKNVLMCMRMGVWNYDDYY